jgi:transposase InsO family protein
LVNDKRVKRIWRREGLKVPARRPKRARLWLADGSCIRLRAERPNHVWSYDFVEERTHDRRKIRLLGEIFYSLREAQIVIESWRRHYNTIRPHASIGYRAPAPEVFVPALAAWPSAQPRPAPPAMLSLAPRP